MLTVYQLPCGKMQMKGSLSVPYLLFLWPFCFKHSANIQTILRSKGIDLGYSLKCLLLISCQTSVVKITFILFHLLSILARMWTSANSDCPWMTFEKKNCFPHFSFIGTTVQQVKWSWGYFHVCLFIQESTYLTLTHPLTSLMLNFLVVWSSF